MGKKQNPLDKKLYKAVKSGKEAVAEELIAKGADPEAKVGKKGLTAMDRAMSIGNQKMFTMLRTSTMKRKNKSAPEEGAGDVGTFVKKAGPLDDDDVSAGDTGTIVRKAPPADDGAGDTGTIVKKAPSEVRFDEAALRGGGSGLIRGARESMKRKKSSDDAPDGYEEVVEQEIIPPDEDAENKTKEDYEFPREKLEDMRQIGEGTFGIVFEATAVGIYPGEERTKVACKMLQEKKSDLVEDFFKEVKIMMAMGSKHKIVRLLGIVTKEEPYMMIMELMENGDLKTVLRENRPKGSNPSRFSMQHLAAMSADIAEGMSYLTKLKIVHRDLATRNCLVSTQYEVKIGDFGLTRDVYEGEYYRMTGSAPLPIRWMSPEAIMDGKYTSASDVWSFGICLWELMTFAKLPYPGFSNMEVCDKVCEEDFRMPQPKGCPNEIYQIMMQCWDEEPEERQTFADLHLALKQLSSTLSSARITKDDMKGLISTSKLPAVEEPADYEEPQDTIAQVAAEYDNGDASQGASTDYYLKSDKEDVDDQKQYVDQRYEGLDSFTIAMKVASRENNVVDVNTEKTAVGTVVEKAAQEEYANPEYSHVTKVESQFEYEIPVPAGSNYSRMTSKEVLQPPEKKEEAKNEAPEEVRKPGGSIHVNSYYNAAFKPKAKTETKTAKEAPKQTKTTTTKDPQKAALAKRYGGATSWVQQGPAAVVAVNPNTTAQRSQEELWNVTPDASADDPVDDPILLKAKNKTKSGSKLPGYYGAKPKATPVNSAFANNKKSTPASNPTKPNIPQHNPVSKKGAPQQQQQQQGNKPLSAIHQQKSVLQSMAGSTGSIEMTAADEAAKQTFSLTNDQSETANKARAHRSAIVSKAEADVADWISGVIGHDIPHQGLQKTLKNGMILCEVMNKLLPGSIKNIHTSKMAFRQMENIGFFLEACEAYGVISKDLFMTVDLFEGRQMQVVLNCLASLQRVARSKGYKG